MAITTNAQLETAVANWLHRDDLTSRIPEFVTVAETRLFRELRVKDMETAFSTAITSGTITLPTSYVDLKYAYVDESPVTWLERKPAAWIFEKYPTRSSDGKPKFIARQASTFIFGPYPDSTYTIAGVYYKNIGPVSSSAHALFTNNPDLYLFAALLEAVPFLEDDKRVPLWLAKYNDSLTRLQGQSDREEYSGSTLAVRPG